MSPYYNELNKYMKNFVKFMLFFMIAVPQMVSAADPQSDHSLTASTEQVRKTPIHVKTFAGVIQLELSDIMTVLDIKKLIYQKEPEFPVNQQVLLRGKAKLDDNLVLGMIWDELRDLTNFTLVGPKKNS